MSNILVSYCKALKNGLHKHLVDVSGLFTVFLSTLKENVPCVDIVGSVVVTGNTVPKSKYRRVCCVRSP